MSGTEIAYGAGSFLRSKAPTARSARYPPLSACGHVAICLCTCYAMSGTDREYGATGLYARYPDAQY
eukprot:1770544-Rhodomonas_salina.2